MVREEVRYMPIDTLSVIRTPTIPTDRSGVLNSGYWLDFVVSDPSQNYQEYKTPPSS